MHTLTETADTWFRYVEFEVQDLCALLEERDVLSTLRSLRRVVRVLRQLLTMRRFALGDADEIVDDPGLGRDVIGLRRLGTVLCGRVWPAYLGLLSHFGLQANDLYGPHCADDELYQLSERLLELDRLMEAWAALLPGLPEVSETAPQQSFRDLLVEELERTRELELAGDAEPPPEASERRQRAGTAPIYGHHSAGRRQPRPQTADG